MIPSSKKFLLAGLVLLMTSSFASARVLNLDDCIREALKNHPDVNSARGQAKAAGSSLWQAFGQFLPSLSAGISGSQVRSEPGSIIIGGEVITSGGISKNYGASLSSNMVLFNGGQNVFDYLGAKADKSYYEYISALTEQNLIYTVKTTYYAYLATMKLGEANREAVKRGEEQYKLASSKYEIGSASKSDVLKAQVQFGRDKLALLESENGVRKARANLAYLIGIDVNSDIDFSRDYVRKSYDGTEDTALKFGMSNYPGLLASEKRVTSAKYAKKSAWGQFLPSISANVSRSWSNTYFSDLTGFHNEDARWTIGASVSIPIFENFSRTASLSRARVNLSAAQASYNYAKNNVASEIKQAYLNITKAKETMKLEEENEAAAKEDLTLVQEKYNLGAATILELLDAQISLITAQNNKIQAEFDYNLAVAKLENAMGVK
jgi:outer membrane protein